jgi:hypothetical protein
MVVTGGANAMGFNKTAEIDGDTSFHRAFSMLFRHSTWLVRGLTNYASAKLSYAKTPLLRISLIIWYAKMPE